MQRVVIDARESGTTTGRYVDKLVENLHSLSPNYEFVILSRKSRSDFFRLMAPKFSFLESDVKEFSLREQTELLRQIKSLEADLVHFPMVQQPAFYGGRAVSGIADLTTTRFRNPAKNKLVFSFKQLVYKWLIKRVAKKSEKILTISEFVKRDVAQYTKVPETKIVVTYPAADKISEHSELIKPLVDKKFIMYVGRPLPHKNLERLVEAFKVLQKRQTDLTLVLVGKKDVLFNRLEQKIQKEGLSGVFFTDFVSEGQLKWLYENTAAYVFPSLSEGFGLPGLEAMVHGAPVVSSNATCLPEIYGEAANYFDPTDISDMAAKISEVLDDKNLREKLVGAGKIQAGKYSWKRMAEQTLAVYEEVLTSTSPDT